MNDINDFSEAMGDPADLGNRVMRTLILGAVLLGIIIEFVFLIIGRTMIESAAAATAAMFALLPLGAAISWVIPAFASSMRLTDRGIALTGRKMIKKYGGENAVVFNDLHLFKKCEPKNVGFVCYEEGKTAAVLAALGILYSRIGGPMCEVFSNVPEEYAARRIRVRRITRSGVEAVIDKSHILVVGDAEFMRRYGIVFPSSEGQARNGRNTTLYVSYDGRATAKLTAVYKVEPLFDMLIERLAKEGIHCVIETYDPMISAELISRVRPFKGAPVNVVHKSAADYSLEQHKHLPKFC